MYSVIFSNGVILTNLIISGNMFCTDTFVGREMFPDIIEKITIIDPEGNEEIIENGSITIYADTPEAGRYVFSVFPLMKEELRYAQTRSDLEYVAMMSGADLSEEGIERFSEKSKNYQKVKDFYENKLWNLTRVRNAVIKEWITEEEFKEITGEEY